MVLAFESVFTFDSFFENEHSPYFQNQPARSEDHFKTRILSCLEMEQKVDAVNFLFKRCCIGTLLLFTKYDKEQGF